MERRDYLLREIEKIGLVLNAIRQKFFGGKENLAIHMDQHFNEAKGKLLNDLNFDLDHFLNLEKEESEKYLASFKGFDANNMEELADLLSEIGFSEESEKSKIYLGKALELYELSGVKSKTFSFDRQSKISKIKSTI